MILQNENGKFVNPEDLKHELLLEPIDEDITETDLENGLSEMYLSALKSDLAFYGSSQTVHEGLFSGLGKKILDQIKSFICPKLNDESTQDTIVDTILDAIASIIPGGKIITLVVKKLIKFILKKGIGNLCPVQTNKQVLLQQQK